MSSRAAWFMIAATAITGIIISLGVMLQTASEAHGATTRTEFMPCSTDEGPDADRNCVWDARHIGNGMGNSYFVGEGGKVTPLPHHIAHFLIYGK